MSYPLPRFVSLTVTNQPTAPRRVSVLSVTRAVLIGVDCSIYAFGSLALIVFGVAVMVHALPSTSPASDVPFGRFFVVVGLLCALLPSYRVWQVYKLLRYGDAHVAEVVSAEVGAARIYGTPWGEPMVVQGRPIAARGTYQLADTGEVGSFYMQQWWATALQPGTRIWVLRRNGRDVLYAPTEDDRATASPSIPGVTLLGR